LIAKFNTTGSTLFSNAADTNHFLSTLRSFYLTGSLRSGRAIVKAILEGERDPYQLAELRDPRVRATKEQIAPSLEGNWQEDLLFILRQEHEAHRFCEKQIAACDQA
jgi:hypothetical protein